MPDHLCERCRRPGSIEKYDLVAYFSADLCHNCFRDWCILYGGDLRALKLETAQEKLQILRGRLTTVPPRPAQGFTRTELKLIESLSQDIRRHRTALMEACQAWIASPENPVHEPQTIGFWAGRKKDRS